MRYKKRRCSFQLGASQTGYGLYCQPLGNNKESPVNRSASIPAVAEKGKERREKLEWPPSPDPAADHWQSGTAWQTTMEQVMTSASLPSCSPSHLPLDSRAAMSCCGCSVLLHSTVTSCLPTPPHPQMKGGVPRSRKPTAGLSNRQLLHVEEQWNSTLYALPAPCLPFNHFIGAASVLFVTKEPRG